MPGIRLFYESWLCQSLGFKYKNKNYTWNVYKMAWFNSTRALSRHKEKLLLMSKPIFSAINFFRKIIRYILKPIRHIENKFTGSLLNRLASAKSFFFVKKTNFVKILFCFYACEYESFLKRSLEVFLWLTNCFELNNTYLKEIWLNSSELS